MIPRKEYAPRKQISVGILSLGCPKTLVDSELALGLLDQTRYRIAARVTDCDVALLNTCSFIGEAKEESIDHIVKLAELKREGKIKGIVVLGCLVQRYQKELQKELPEVDAFLGTGDYGSLNSVLARVAEGKRVSCVGSDPGFLYTADMNRVPLTPPHSRYIKISEGCDHACTFCTIPAFRGRLRSRATEDIVEEAEQLVQMGARELVLTGQDTTSFGRDRNRQFLLPKLLQELNQIRDLKWIRILYAHPSCVSEALIEAIGSLEKVCHYLDLPLQHASDRILSAMKRGISKTSARKLIEKLRSRIPDLAIRSSFIVGFPGETESDFEELLAFLEEVRFERLGLFVYSREEGSDAFEFNDQVPEIVKRKRFERGMILQQNISLEHNRAMIGKRIPILIEGRAVKNAPACVGRSYQDAPEVDGLVTVRTPESLKFDAGDFVLAEIEGAEEYDLIARFISRA